MTLSIGNPPELNLIWQQVSDGSCPRPAEIGEKPSVGLRVKTARNQKSG
jgi:hypothetical protein